MLKAKEMDIEATVLFEQSVAGEMFEERFKSIDGSDMFFIYTDGGQKGLDDYFQPNPKLTKKDLIKYIKETNIEGYFFGYEQLSDYISDYLEQSISKATKDDLREALQEFINEMIASLSWRYASEIFDILMPVLPSMKMFYTYGYNQGDAAVVFVLDEFDLKQEEIDRLFWDLPVYVYIKIGDKEYYDSDLLKNMYEYDKDEVIKKLSQEYSKEILKKLEQLLPDYPKDSI